MLGTDLQSIKLKFLFPKLTRLPAVPLNPLDRKLGLCYKIASGFSLCVVMEEIGLSVIWETKNRRTDHLIIQFIKVERLLYRNRSLALRDELKHGPLEVFLALIVNRALLQTWQISMIKMKEP